MRTGFFSPIRHTTKFPCFLYLKIFSQCLRRNLIGNRAISVLRGQKPCTRIILSILKSFLCCLKAEVEAVA